MNIKKICPITKIELEMLYIFQDISIVDIGIMIGRKPEYVERWMREYDIPIRTYDEEYIKKETERLLSMNITHDILYNLYWVQGHSAPKISKMYGYTMSTVYKWLRFFNIPGRDISFYSGNKSWHWEGGITNKPYCNKFDEKCRESNRDKFHRECFLCGEAEGKRKLSVHHVDSNKMQGCDTEWQLVPLCQSCHMSITGKYINNYYEDYFSILLYVRKLIIDYNGKIDYKSIGF